mmetsp:Transcript_124850/g.230193  ORF Transcript_124850/g.230193 Transcript_124850/m.230193 type:complete len:282 (+) Transcript_124850:1011-1856(+)
MLRRTRRLIFFRFVLLLASKKSQVLSIGFFPIGTLGDASCITGELAFAAYVMDFPLDRILADLPSNLLSSFLATFEAVLPGNLLEVIHKTVLLLVCYLPSPIHFRSRRSRRSRRRSCSRRHLLANESSQHPAIRFTPTGSIGNGSSIMRECTFAAYVTDLPPNHSSLHLSCNLHLVLESAFEKRCPGLVREDVLQYVALVVCYLPVPRKIHRTRVVDRRSVAITTASTRSSADAADRRCGHEARLLGLLQQRILALAPTFPGCAASQTTSTLTFAKAGGIC